MRWFYNLKISAKLLIGFIIVSLIAGVVGVVGIINLKSLDNLDTKLYEENVMGIVDITDAQQRYLQERVEVGNLVLYAGKDRTETYKNIEDNIAKLEKGMSDYDKTITDKEDRDNYTALTAMYKQVKGDYADIVNASKAEKSVSEIVDKFAAYKADCDAFAMQLDKISTWNSVQAKDRSDGNTASANRTTLLMIIIVAAAIIISIALGIFISSIISKPVIQLTEAANKFAVGDIDVHVNINTKDEIGHLVSAFKAMAQGIREQVNCIERMAEGDMTVTANIRSEKDVMNIKLEELLTTNNQVFGDIRNAADQVEAAAGQVAAGSQTMAQGATEQASIVEEVNASVEEIASQSKQNANNSRRANELAVSAKETATQGSQKMKEMMSSMNEINEASGSISKIIKVIDEIAFQTNILALNAAVEAARAGQHGKGFAVVAEEVRNLAGRSKDAAKETTELIEGTIKKTENGTIIAKDTADALNRIMGIITEVANTIDTISNASNEQAAAVSQISLAIGQVAGTTQTNSATAEESAAASEELSSQAVLLKESVARFIIKNESFEKHISRQRPEIHQIEKKATDYDSNKKKLNIGTTSYGKY